MIRYSAEFGEISGAVKSLTLEIDRRTPELLALLGRELRRLVLDAFAAKSRGGRGDDGIQWAPIRPSTRRQKRTKGSAVIGVDTGEMSDPRNLDITIRGSVVTVEFTHPVARLFRVRRPLMPAEVPDVWLKRLESIAQAWLDRVAQEAGMTV